MSKVQSTVSDTDARTRLLTLIERESGPLTLGEVVSQTGLEPQRAERLLGQLIKDYESALDVSEEGDLIYRFKDGLQARRDIVAADAARRRWAAVKSAMMTGFKVWTVAMVIIYTIVYVTLLLAVMVAASSQSKGRQRRGPSFGGSFFRYLIIRDLFYNWGGRRGHYGRRHGGYGGGYHVDRRVTFGRDDKDEPTVLDKTWYYLFGATAEHRTPLENEKELLTYIQAHRGLITNADIMGVLGVPYDEADAIGTRLAATYRGEIDLSDEGTVIYRFPLLLRTADPSRAAERAELVNPLVDKAAAQMAFTWTLRERAQRLREAGSGFVPWLNVFNLVLAGFTYTTLMPILQLSGFWAVFWLVAFPGVYSLLFLALGLRRMVSERARLKAEREENIRLSVCKFLFSKRRSIRLPKDAGAIARGGLGRFTADDLAALVPTFAEQLRGQLDISNNGATILRTDLLLDELKTVEALRKSAAASTPVGRTVFSSVPGGYEERPADELALIEAIEDADIVH